MADASDIYRRFVATPLRLKSRLPPASTPASPLSTRSSFTDAGCSESPGVPGRSSEVSRLRRRVAKFRISIEEEDALDAGKEQLRRVKTRSDTERSTGTSPADAAAPGLLGESQTRAPKTLLKKKKRVTRAVTMQNSDTGEEFVDTPTKASQPPKRRRKFSSDGAEMERTVPAFCLDGALPEDEGRHEAIASGTSTSTAKRKSVTVTVQTRPLRRSRRLQGVKLASPKITLKPATSETSVEKAVEQATPEILAEVSAPETPESTPSAVLPVDWISTLCDPLLSTNTISGCFFALSLNSLRSVQHTLIPTPTSSELNPFENVFTICHEIAQCEKIAQRSFSPPSLKTKAKSVSPRRKHGGGVKKALKRKKSVRFQSFDLSCLNLQYVEDERVAMMVEEILTHYGAIMEQVEVVVSGIDNGANDGPDSTIFRELVRLMASPSELYCNTPPDCVSEVEAWKKIYRRAFGGRDSYSQHEIRICGEYFARQFANLLSPRVSPSLPPQFLQSVFSSLASSSLRFKLRELFVANENFEENLDERISREVIGEDGKPFPAMAPYEHQDLGAAIHWALQESLLYEALVQPLRDMLEHKVSADGGSDAEPSVATYLDESAPEDLDRMEKYVLARRFLRFHITKSWRHRSESDDAGKSWISIEKVCALAKRFNFEDEAHLFPLASVEKFVGTLAREESTLQQMQEVLQSFYEQKYGLSGLQPEPCMECHHTITREENPSSIRCTSCASRFHLGCLHLPESFAQYAEHYVCPACFLGRGGY